MKYTKITSIIMLLLLSFSLVSAYVGQDNIPTYEELLKENVMLKQQIKTQRIEFNKEFLDFANRCIIRDPLKQYISFDKSMTIEELINPQIIRRSGSSTVITNTIVETIACEKLECRTNERFIYDGFDENGCRMNQECIKVPAPQPLVVIEVKPDIRI